MLFCRLRIFFQNKLFEKNLSGIPLECQTVWTLIRPDDSSGLILVQTVCQGNQQKTCVDTELSLIHWFLYDYRISAFIGQLVPNDIKFLAINGVGLQSHIRVSD